MVLYIDSKNQTYCGDLNNCFITATSAATNFISAIQELLELQEQIPKSQKKWYNDLKPCSRKKKGRNW